MKPLNPFIFPISKQPYDFSLEDNLSMYDKLPYQRNYDRCNGSMVTLVSGNMIKFFRCTSTEPVQIQTQDENFSSILSAHAQQEAKERAEFLFRYPHLAEQKAQEKEHTEEMIEEEDS